MIVTLQALIFFRESLLNVLDRLLRPYYKKFSLTFGRNSDVSDDEELEDQVFSEFDDEKGVVFYPPVYLQRYAAVSDCLLEEQWLGKLVKVVDLGCNNMSFIKYIKEVNGIQCIYGVDIENHPINRSSDLVDHEDYRPKRESPLQVTLFQGNAADPDYRLIGCDAVIAIEMIEHMLPHDLERLVHTVFGFIKPWVAIFTTPNGDFNTLFKALEKNGLRRLDHFFEWTREQFHDWCSNIVIRYPKYTVTCKGIGPGPPGTTHLGCCSQMAVFISKDYHKQQDLDLNSLALVADAPSAYNMSDLVDTWDSTDKFTENNMICPPDIAGSFTELETEKQSCVTISVAPQLHSQLSSNADAIPPALSQHDMTLQCNLDIETGKNYLMYDYTQMCLDVVAPRRKLDNRVYTIEDINSRLNCTIAQVTKFSKTTQNLIAKNKMDSLVHTREVVDEIRHLTKMLNFNQDSQPLVNGVVNWHNINWGENAPYWNQYYKVVREFNAPYEVKSEESRITELISDEINRLIDSQCDKNCSVDLNRMEIPVEQLMPAVTHITNDVETVKELLEWNGYEIVGDVLIHSRLVVDNTSTRDTYDDDWQENSTPCSDWDCTDVRSTWSGGSTVILDTQARCLHRALDQKVRKLRTMMTADEDITTELNKVVYKLTKLALRTSRGRDTPPPAKWMQCKLLDLLTLTEKAIYRRKQLSLESRHLKSIAYDASGNSLGIVALEKIKEDDTASKIVDKYSHMIHSDCEYIDDLNISEEEPNLTGMALPDQTDEKAKRERTQAWLHDDFEAEPRRDVNYDNDISSGGDTEHNTSLYKQSFKRFKTKKQYMELKCVISKKSHLKVMEQYSKNHKKGKDSSKAEIIQKVSKKKSRYNKLYENSSTNFVSVDYKHYRVKHRRKKNIVQPTASKPIPAGFTELCHPQLTDAMKDYNNHANSDHRHGGVTNSGPNLGISATQESHFIEFITNETQDVIAMQRTIGTDLQDDFGAFENEIVIGDNVFDNPDVDTDKSQTIFLNDINEPSTSSGIRHASMDVECGPDVSAPTYSILSATTSITKISGIFSAGVKIGSSSTDIKQYNMKCNTVSKQKKSSTNCCTSTDFDEADYKTISARERTIGINIKEPKQEESSSVVMPEQGIMSDLPISSTCGKDYLIESRPKGPVIFHGVTMIPVLKSPRLVQKTKIQYESKNQVQDSIMQRPESPRIDQTPRQESPKRVIKSPVTQIKQLPARKPKSVVTQKNVSPERCTKSNVPKYHSIAARPVSPSVRQGFPTKHKEPPKLGLKSMMQNLELPRRDKEPWTVCTLESPNRRQKITRIPGLDSDLHGTGTRNVQRPESPTQKATLSRPESPIQRQKTTRIPGVDSPRQIQGTAIVQRSESPTQKATLCRPESPIQRQQTMRIPGLDSSRQIQGTAIVQRLESPTQKATLCRPQSPIHRQKTTRILGLDSPRQIQGSAIVQRSESPTLKTYLCRPKSPIHRQKTTRIPGLDSPRQIQGSDIVQRSESPTLKANLCRPESPIQRQKTIISGLDSSRQIQGTAIVQRSESPTQNAALCRPESPIRTQKTMRIPGLDSSRQIHGTAIVQRSETPTQKATLCRPESPIQRQKTTRIPSLNSLMHGKDAFNVQRRGSPDQRSIIIKELGSTYQFESRVEALKQGLITVHGNRKSSIESNDPSALQKQSSPQQHKEQTTLRERRLRTMADPESAWTNSCTAVNTKETTETTSPNSEAGGVKTDSESELCENIQCIPKAAPSLANCNFWIKSSVTKDVGVSWKLNRYVRPKLCYGGVQVHSYREKETSEDVMYQGEWQNSRPKVHTTRKIYISIKKTEPSTKKKSVKSYIRKTNQNVQELPSTSKMYNKLTLNGQKNKCNAFVPISKATRPIRNITKTPSKLTMGSLPSKNKRTVIIVKKPSIVVIPARNKQTNKALSTSEVRRYLPAYLRKKALKPEQVKNIVQLSLDSAEENIFNKINTPKALRPLAVEIKQDSLKFQSIVPTANYIVLRNEVENPSNDGAKDGASANRTYGDRGHSTPARRELSPQSLTSSTCSSPSSVATVRAVSIITNKEPNPKHSPSSYKASTTSSSENTIAHRNKKFIKRCTNVRIPNEKQIHNKENIPRTSKQHNNNTSKIIDKNTKGVFCKQQKVLIAHLKDSPPILTANIKPKSNLNVTKNNSLIEKRSKSATISKKPSLSSEVLLSASTATSNMVLVLKPQRTINTSESSSNASNILTDGNKVSGLMYKNENENNLQTDMRLLVEETLDFIDTSSDNCSSIGSATVILSRDPNESSMIGLTFSPVSFKTVILSEDLAFQSNLESALYRSFDNTHVGEILVSEADDTQSAITDHDLASFTSLTSNQSNYLSASDDSRVKLLSDQSDSVKDIYERKEQPFVPVSQHNASAIANLAFSGFSLDDEPKAGDKPDPINLIDSETGSVAFNVIRLTNSEELLVSGRPSASYDTCILDDDTVVPSWLFDIISHQQAADDEAGQPQPALLPLPEDEMFDENGNVEGIALGAGAGDGRGIHSDQSQDSSGRGSLSSSVTSSDHSEAVLVDPSRFMAESEGGSYSLQTSEDSSLIDRLNVAETIATPGTLSPTPPTNGSNQRTLAELAASDADVSSLDTDVPDSS